MAFEIDKEKSKRTKRSVKVFFGYDIDNPAVGKITTKDTFSDVLRSAASHRGKSATSLRNKGYQPIVGNESYNYSDNVSEALEKHNTESITFMAKQKGGSILDSLSSGLFLFSDSIIYKAIPSTTKNSLIESVKKKGSIPDNIMIFGNTVNELKSFTTMELVIDRLKEKILADLSSEYSKSVESLITTIANLFDEKNSKLLSNSKVYPVIKDNKIYLMKDILPYEIEAHGRLYKFTGCTVCCTIWWERGRFRRSGVKIYGNKKYKHPHVYSTNRICLGSGKRGKGNGLMRAITTLKAAEHVLVNGYNPHSRTTDMRKWSRSKGGFA